MCSMKKSVLRSFTKFTGKDLCQSLFFNKVAGLRPATLLKETLAHVFYSEFCEISKNTFFTEHLWTSASVEYSLCSLVTWSFKVRFLLFDHTYLKAKPNFQDTEQHTKIKNSQSLFNKMRSSLSGFLSAYCVLCISTEILNIFNTTGDKCSCSNYFHFLVWKRNPVSERVF